MLTLSNDYRKLGKHGTVVIQGKSAGYQDIDSSGPFVGATVPAIVSATYDIDVSVDGGTANALAVALLITDDWDGIATKIETALQTATSSTETVAIVSGSMRFSSITTGSVSAISLATGTTGSGGGDLVTYIDTITGYDADYALAIAGTNSDLDTIAYQEMANTGTLLSFPGATVPALPSLTYTLDINEDGNGVATISTALLVGDSWDGICVKIQAALRTSTSSTELVQIIDGKIRFTSATEGATSSMVVIEGSSGNGLIAGITAISAAYTAGMETTVPGTEGQVSIDVGKPESNRTGMNFMVQVASSAGLDKSGLISTYSATTGLLNVADNAGTTELAASDSIKFLTWMY